MALRPSGAFSGGIPWLDVTRLLTRIGRAAPTGIDRVETAWAEHLLDYAPGLLGFCRTTRGFLLLHPEGVRALLQAARGDRPLPVADRWSRLAGRGARPRHRAEAMLRVHAVDRAPPWGLAALVRRGKPAVYLNVGHTNLDPGVLGPIRAAGAQVAVLIHDLIPLTHPALVPPRQTRRMADGLQAVGRDASVVIAVSDTTASDLTRHWCGAAWIPRIVTCPPGVPELPALPASGPRDPGRFVMVGTLEPRKNHAVILAAWRVLSERYSPEAIPRLDIVGQEGWTGPEIRAAIEAHPLFGQAIFLDTAGDDAALSVALSRAGTLLYPTLAEGFGLPPREALAAGILPICSDLPVLRDALGSDAVYVDPHEVYSWVETITQRIAGKIAGPDGPRRNGPRWQDHFDGVSDALAALRNGAERP